VLKIVRYPLIKGGWKAKSIFYLIKTTYLENQSSIISEDYRG